VTPEGILSILKLPFLRRFEYVAPVRVSNSFAWQILPQNPSLELLAVNLVTKADAELLKEFNNYPRRLTLIDLVILTVYDARIINFPNVIIYVYFSAGKRMDGTLIMTLTQLTDGTLKGKENNFIRCD